MLYRAIALPYIHNTTCIQLKIRFDLICYTNFTYTKTNAKMDGHIAYNKYVYVDLVFCFMAVNITNTHSMRNVAFRSLSISFYLFQFDIMLIVLWFLFICLFYCVQWNMHLENGFDWHCVVVLATNKCKTSCRNSEMHHSGCIKLHSKQFVKFHHGSFPSTMLAFVSSSSFLLLLLVLIHIIKIFTIKLIYSSFVSLFVVSKKKR